jgi:phage terminase large subunit
VPAEEIDRQKATLPADAFAQEYMGDFRKRTGLVYPEFDVTKHVYTERSGVTIMKLLGEDFGYTNPTALIMVEKDSDENYWVSSEWYRTGKTNTEVTEYVKTLGANKVYPDPAEPDRIEEQRRMGVNVQEVSKDVEKGIDSVREMLKAGTLHIHQSCTTLISEFETYAYEERKANRNEPERPIKENDHGLDAIRYVLHNTASHQKQRAVTFVPHRNIVGRAELARTKSFAQNYSPRMPRQ